MVEIPEYKRDSSKDYLNILKSLNEIPFPVGKNLLADFLRGNPQNNSIEKNKLYDKENFGSLGFLEKDEILELIRKMLMNNFIEESQGFFNKDVKVLGLSMKGKKELLDPTYKTRKEIPQNIQESEISDSDMKALGELNDFLSGLNMSQKKAVVSSKNKILCIAGAGSGKTTVLAKRVQFLNKMKKVKGEDMLAITFTRKARYQMKDRLEKLGVTGVKIETFNSFCEKILLKNTARIYGRKMKVASYQEKMMGVLRALDNLNLTIEDAIHKYFSKSKLKNKNSYKLQAMFVNDCYSVLEYYKSTNKSLEDFSTGLRGKDYESAKMVYGVVKFLLEYMRINNLRTYADQLNDSIDFFKKNPKRIPKFKHILVDEYQDVNSQQVELLSLLESENIFYVGDPRQSIFGWRGSDVSFILNLASENNTEVINLKKNYRSNSHIVSLMNEAIKNMNLNNLESNFENEKEIKLYNFADENAEHNFVSAKILSSNIPKNEIFVLARTNKQLSDLSEILKRRGVKHILKTEDEKSIEPKKEEVTLATIHSIKGLEAEEVFVIGCNKRNFPCVASEHPVIEMLKMYDYNRSEEERRLFYVAISRAKNKLHMTYSGKNHTRFILDEMKEYIDELKY